METDSKYTDKIRILAIAVAVFFVSLVFFLYALSQNPNPVKIVNRSTEQSSQLSAKELSLVRDSLNSFLGGEDVKDVSIRWSSFVKPSESYRYFLVDIDSIQGTYRVSLIGDQVFVECPNIGESKYDNFKCSVPGLDGESTASKLLGDILPYQGSASGVEYMFRQSGSSDFLVHVFDCESDEIKKSVQSNIDDLIKSRNGNPSMFSFEYEYNAC